MPTQQNNRLSVTLTETQMQNVKAAFATIYAELPFLIGLTAEERQSIPKINDSNKTFTEDGANVAANNGSFLPGYFNSGDVVMDITLFQQLDEIFLLSDQLNEKIFDTRMLAGSEAYVNALTIYRLVEAAAKAGVPGADAAYELLKQRFNEQGNGGSNTNNPPSA